MTFSEQLKSHQRRLSLTQPQLAKLLEVSPRLVWKWLNEPDKTPAGITQEGALARLAAIEAPLKFGCPICNKRFADREDARACLRGHEPVSC